MSRRCTILNRCGRWGSVDTFMVAHGSFAEKGGSNMLGFLLRLNHARRLIRWPVKCAILGVTILMVCFPNPSRLVTHIRHWQDPNALIEPNAPAMAPMIEALRPQIVAAKQPQDALRIVERFVYSHIRYDWDWNTWGSADYLPTVTEVIEQGREDCDGQAVLAASLLRNFGFKTELVANFAHMWVRTDQGEAMSPGKNRAVVATKEGPKFSLRGLIELPKATAFGIAVFPLFRELVVLGVLWLMLWNEKHTARRQALMLMLFGGGLVALRAGSHDYRQPVAWMQLTATLTMVVAVFVQVGRSSCAPDGVTTGTSDTTPKP